MAKAKKVKTDRPEKYAEKLLLKVDFNAAMNILAIHANKNAKKEKKDKKKDE